MQTSQATVSPRETEQAAFANVTRGLQEADTEPKRVRALGRNHDLWSALVKDLALAGNGLAPEIKANLITLGAWSMRYSTLALLQKLPVQPLVDVNANIADGLALQGSPAAVQGGDIKLPVTAA